MNRRVLAVAILCCALAACSDSPPPSTPSATPTDRVSAPPRPSVEYLYAINKAECYRGPSTESGRFYFKPTAQAPLTLDKNDKYRVLAKEGDWIQVDVFGTGPWVRARDMASSLGSAAVTEIYKERLNSFNQVQSMGGRKTIHAGVKIDGNTLTLLVNDRWHSLSRDMKEAYVKDSVSTFFGMGGARGIQETASDYTIEVRHNASDRVLATMDAVWGLKIKND